MNIPPSIVSFIKPEELTNPEEMTFVSSDIWLLDNPALATLVPTPAPAQYIKENIQRITKLCINLFL